MLETRHKSEVFPVESELDIIQTGEFLNIASD